MEDAANAPAQAAHTPSSSAEKAPQPRAQCVLLCAHQAPPDLARALDHKGISTTRADTPEIALALLVRAHRDANRSGRRGPIILVAVAPDALGEAADRLLRCVTLYAPHAVAWRFDQHRSPQLSAWRPTPPKPVVVTQPAPAPASTPATTQPPRPSVEPRLRLVGEQSFRAPPPPPGTAFFAGPGIPLAPGTRRPSDAGPANGSGQESDAESPPPPVSDAEMSMLLSGERKTDPRPPRRS
jgi:hypothetical protein